MINIGSMSSSQRNKLADTILAASENMSVSEKADLVEKLQILLEADVKAKAETDRKTAFASKLSAMRADQHVGAASAIKLVEGDLHRANCPPLEDLGMKPLHEINTILAAAKIEPVNRMAIKNLLARLGAI